MISHELVDAEQVGGPGDPALDALPRLSRDASFWGMTATQFLGAFNDNLFKQMILLLAVDYAVRRGATGDIYQPLAAALFALPFVLFSGFAGWLSDRMSKRTIVVGSKVAEIAVMLLGALAFLTGGLSAPLAVLFLMGVQSAFFGPAKYGILPEMLRERDLPPANGIIQMTTFLSIILGAAAAGILKQEFGGELWNVTLVCVGIAVAGTLTAVLVRRTAVAQPGLPFDVSAVGVNRDTWALLMRDRTLFGVLMVSSLFWFLGGVVHQAVNAFGKNQLRVGDVRTSYLLMFLAIGIAAGCVFAGKLSGHRVRFGLVTLGAWGMVLTLGVLAAIGAGFERSEPDHAEADYLAVLLSVEMPRELIARLALTTMGVFAGLFVVPLQVFLQARPPRGQKGRMIGTMNLINWIAILLSAGFYLVCTMLLSAWNLGISWTFGAMALLLLPVALFYRPRTGE